MGNIEIYFDLFEGIKIFQVKINQAVETKK